MTASLPPPDGKAPALLDVRGLSVAFSSTEGTVTAVDGLSFSVAPGETVALVGESGSGKSVTALAITRLVDYGGGRIGGGEIHFRRRDGTIQDLARGTAAGLRSIRGDEIAMVFQEPMTSLNPVFTVGEQIAESLRLHQGLTRRDALDGTLTLLRKVRIPDAGRILSRHPHQLSGGMRQRVMIAMALACRPSLLIADEPTTALDVTIQAEILRLIRLLQRDMGMAVLFITHDMGVVAEMADRVVVMRQGRKVEDGETRALFDRPAHPYTRALLAAVPRLGSLRDQPLPAPFALPSADGTPPPHPAPQDTVRGQDPELLSVDRLTARFDVRRGVFGRLAGRIHAVEQVSFAIRPGETLALVGESGCGKSTTGRALAQMLRPVRGTVRFEGRDLARMAGPDRRELRRRIQYVFQDPFASLDPRLTVGFSIAEPLLTHGLARGRDAGDRVAELLTRVGLSPDHAKRYPFEFSGGQRQRLCIARALACEPRLIVADEAVAALDVSIQAQIVNLLMALQRDKGLAYLFISHDMAVVERVSHRVAVMYLGQIVEIGPRVSIFGDPRHPYTRRLLAAVPVADPARRRREDSPAGPDDDGREIASPMRAPDAEPVVPPLIEVGPGHFVAAHPVGDYAGGNVAQARALAPERPC
ncbi:MAG: dipeptide ABC transporter ATP-binding protein [Telmatospirillum sp.]|nr:dipeptide ABC transporter ATP-binding protein [Telmatospirillum sp.]